LQQGKWFLWRGLKERFHKVKVVHGWRTSGLRKALGLEKTHQNDAAAMVVANNPRCEILHIKPLRAKAVRDQDSKQTLEKQGFRHYDVLKSYKRTVGNFRGMVRGLGEKSLFLKTQAKDNAYAPYTKSKVLYRPRGLVYF